MGSEPDYRQKIQEIEEVAHQVCTEWECGFIEEMIQWEGEYTSKQKDVIDRIYRKVCDSPY